MMTLCKKRTIDVLLERQLVIVLSNIIDTQRYISRFRTPPAQQTSHPLQCCCHTLMDCISKRCIGDIRSIPSIFSEESCKLRDREWDGESETVVQHLPTFSQYIARRKKTPPLTKTITDIKLDGSCTDICIGDRFFLFDDGDNTSRIVTFATCEIDRHLAEADTSYCDGTFYTFSS